MPSPTKEPAPGLSGAGSEGADDDDYYVVKCHCGRVRARFAGDVWRKAKDDNHTVRAWKCDCSDCNMRGNVHAMVPQDALQLDMSESLEDATTLYRWGTGIAERRFCKTCGILPWYKPRSNPGSYGVTIMCLDSSRVRTPPKIIVEHFDGQNWEETMRKLKKDKEEL